MRLLHITFHKGCHLEIEYVFKKLGHEIEVMYFDDGVSKGSDLYKIDHKLAQRCWDKYKDYFNTFDGIITSDTCPTSRPFLQNNWSKLLIIWICNRFDYEIKPEKDDPEFYQLLREIPNRKNVFILGDFNCFAQNAKKIFSNCNYLFNNKFTFKSWRDNKIKYDSFDHILYNNYNVNEDKMEVHEVNDLSDHSAISFYIR